MAQRVTTTDKPSLEKSKKERVSGTRPLSDLGEPKSGPLLGGIRLQESVTIDVPAQQLYDYWRNFSNLPRFTKNLKSVQVIDDTRSRWTVDGPAGKELSWEATIIDDRPGEMISWRSIEGSDFDNAGSIWFQPATTGRGTVVKLIFSYNPPAGPLGSLVAKLSGKEPAMLLKQQLRRFKQLMETGEIATTGGQPVVKED